jgi:hypothetical protein
VALLEVFVLLAESVETAATIGIALYLNAKRTTGSKWALDDGGGAWIVFVLLLTSEHAAVLDARRLLQVLDRGAFGRERDVALELVLRTKAAGGRSWVAFFPKESRGVVERRRIEGRRVSVEHELLATC